MKKIKPKILLFILLYMVSVIAYAYDIAVENADGITIYYSYINDGKELKVVQSPGNGEYSGVVTIPDEVTYMNRTRKVTAIDKYAFYHLRYLTSVIIGNNVTSIVSESFHQCFNLRLVIIGDGVTTIEDDAFSNCGVESVTIGNSVTSIGNSAFELCTNLASITFSNSVTSIGESAFYQCFNLSSVIFGNSVASIGKRAFYGCSKLNFLTIPNNVISIGPYAFEDCSRLTSLTVGNGVTSIGVGAFKNCNALIDVTLGNSVTSIGGYAFHDCSGLSSVTIPNSVTSIGAGAFYGCSGLSSVTIPNSVTSIEEDAFHGCSGLISVNIPDNITSIARWTFQDCSGLTSITIPHTVTSIDIGAFLRCGSLTSIIIPNNVTTIGSSAFNGCSNLTSVSIPNSVKSIGAKTFENSDVQTIYSSIATPFVINGKSSEDRTFSINTFNNATLYVPVGTIEKYKATEGWKDFYFIEESALVVPETESCSMPTISYLNGCLTFYSATEGATCHYTITDRDVKSGISNEVELTVTYNISVYASKTGYFDSKTAMATLCWVDANPQTEGLSNNVTNVTRVNARAFLIQNDGGLLTVEGANDGERVIVYTANGIHAGSAISRNGSAVVGTNLKKGNIAIVKVGEKSVKVVVK